MYVRDTIEPSSWHISEEGGNLFGVVKQVVSLALVGHESMMKVEELRVLQQRFIIVAKEKALVQDRYAELQKLGVALPLCLAFSQKVCHPHIGESFVASLERLIAHPCLKLLGVVLDALSVPLGKILHLMDFWKHIRQEPHGSEVDQLDGRSLSIGKLGGEQVFILLHEGKQLDGCC